MRGPTVAIFGLLAFCVTAPPSARADDPADRKPLSVEQVAEMIHLTHPLRVAEVVALGDRLFPAFQEILTNPTKYRKRSVEAVFYLLMQMNGDRSQFFDHAMASLGDTNHLTRHFVASFLGSAGTEKEAGPLALLLLDESTSTRLAAARALAKIGGAREVVMFDLILKNANRYEENGKLILSNFDLEEFEKRRDELKARLKKQDEEKKKPEPKK